MTTSATDISFVLSGGSGNLNPNLSLGGSPSATPIVNNSLNNLFDDVDSNENEIGHEDYRCIYIFNDGDTTIFNSSIYIHDDFEAGSILEIGIEAKNEVQKITISNDSVTGGSVTLSYEGQQFILNHDSDLSVWAENLKTQLSSLELNGFLLLKDVVVTAQNAGPTTVIFDISFLGRDGNRNHDEIQVVSNNLVPPVSVNVTIPQQGSPINRTASAINVDTTPPGGVSFFVPTKQSPIVLPYLKPNEGFPIWIKRITEVGTIAVENDGVILRFSSQSLEPNL